MFLHDALPREVVWVHGARSSGVERPLVVTSGSVEELGEVQQLAPIGSQARSGAVFDVSPWVDRVFAPCRVRKHPRCGAANGSSLVLAEARAASSFVVMDEGDDLVQRRHGFTEC